MLRRGQEEIDREGIAQPSEDVGAPSGPADPVAAVSAHSESEVSVEASTRKPGHHKEVKERNKPTEALKEVIERNPGCREGSACAGKTCCSCVARPLAAGSVRAGDSLTEVLCKVDMCEVFSLPRVGIEARKFGLSPGDAMDITTGWDFNKEEDRQRAEAYLDKEEPLVLIGSPPCVAFSQLQSLIPDSDRKRKQLAEGIRHREFVVKLYRKQRRG